MIEQEEITKLQALQYEIAGSWWSKYIGFDWGRELTGSYFAWKVKRKHRRYRRMRYVKQTIAMYDNNRIGQIMREYDKRDSK